MSHNISVLTAKIRDNTLAFMIEKLRCSSRCRSGKGAGYSCNPGFRVRIVLASSPQPRLDACLGTHVPYLGSPSVPLDAIIDHHVLDVSTMVMWNLILQIS